MGHDLAKKPEKYIYLNIKDTIIHLNISPENIGSQHFVNKAFASIAPFLSSYKTQEFYISH